MKLSNATVKKEHKQIVSVLRECAANQWMSFTDDEMAHRIGIDPYNMARRAARFQRDLEGWVERSQITVVEHVRNRNGVLELIPVKTFIWYLHEDKLHLERTFILAEFKRLKGIE